MSRLVSYTVFTAFLLLFLSQDARADIYKYIDDAGVIHFSNIPVDRHSKAVVTEKTLTGQGSAPAPNPGRGGGSAIYVNEQPLNDDVPYSEIINNKCARYGVDPQLVRAIIKAESNFNPNAVSRKGAVGLMQLMPETAAILNVENSFDPEQNIDGGVRYVRYLLDNFDGDIELTVAAYNCGEGRVYRNGNCVPDIKETKNYVEKVMRLSKNPITGMEFSRPIYKVQLKDGSIIFTDNPVLEGSVSRVK